MVVLTWQLKSGMMVDSLRAHMTLICTIHLPMKQLKIMVLFLICILYI